LVTSNYFAFNGVSGYGASDTIRPGRAYWVKAAAAGNIILDVKYTSRSVPVVPGEERIPDLNELNTIVFSPVGSENASTRLYFTGRDDEALRSDLFEMPPAPPQGAFDVRFSSNRFLEFMPAEGGRELPILIQGVQGKISVTSRPGIGSTRTYALVEKAGDRVVATHSLVDGGSFTIDASSGTRFSIVENGLPVSFALEQNYPNPFNPTTTVRYSLPVDGFVSLRIFNVLGEEVAAPISGDFTQAGFHVSDIDASAWSTGTYFYTLRVRGADGREFSESRKMLLMK
jgi:hypothetical protein